MVIMSSHNFSQWHFAMKIVTSSLPISFPHLLLQIETMFSTDFVFASSPKDWHHHDVFHQFRLRIFSNRSTRTRYILFLLLLLIALPNFGKTAEMSGGSHLVLNSQKISQWTLPTTLNLPTYNCTRYYSSRYPNCTKGTGPNDVDIAVYFTLSKCHLSITFAHILCYLKCSSLNDILINLTSAFENDIRQAYGATCAMSHLIIPSTIQSLTHDSEPTQLCPFNYEPT